MIEDRARRSHVLCSCFFPTRDSARMMPPLPYNNGNTHSNYMHTLKANIICIIIPRRENYA